jgi:pimeloyl-ACP methyl ester carboxylesterase
MRRAAVFCLILGVPVPSLARASAFQIIDKKEVPVLLPDGNYLRRITTTVQNGGSPLNRFVVERVLLAGQNPTTPLILAPALGFSNKMYTNGLQPGGGDFENSIAANLARGGADVFLYSSRQALLASHACDPPADCSAAREWGLQARLDDFVFIRNQIAAEHGTVKPVVGGHSLGGATGVAAVNQDPNAYAGLILIESTLAPWSNATTRANYQTSCDNYHAQLPGQPFDSGLAPFEALFWASYWHPFDPVDPAYGFPPGTPNRVAYLAAAGAASPGPPSLVFPPGLVPDVTDVMQNKFVFAYEPEVTSLGVNAANNYTPTAELVDLSCAWAGDRKFTGNLGAFTGPVLVFESERGIGIEAQSTLALLGSRNIQVLFKPLYGHNDQILAFDHATQVEQPILAWMAQALGN